jgi:transposase InsO family protein
MVLLAHIRAQFLTSNETYGAPRMHVELKEEGLAVGRHRVARLMRDNGLKALQKRRYKKTTDISYIWTAEGWLYLAIVLDLYSRRIIGWATSDRLKKDLALNALRRAIAVRQPSPGLIQYTDRGSQYCSYDYQRLLKAHGIIPSMSGKGNCYDNAMVETVFKTIKNELVWRTIFQTRAAAELALGRYIDGFYNPRRRHSALGYKSPASFEAEMAITE